MPERNRVSFNNLQNIQYPLRLNSDTPPGVFGDVLFLIELLGLIHSAKITVDASSVLIGFISGASVPYV
jgi:hypothetical protein